MVFGSHAKRRAMYSIPPCPSLAASMAAYRRRSFSDSHPKNRCIFPSISAVYSSIPSSWQQGLRHRQNTTAQASREVILHRILSVVTLNDSGSPTWHGRPTAKWLIEKTGFDIDALLPQDDSLDLDAVESKIETLPKSEEELRSIPGYHHVRWTEEIVRFLPGLLTSARAYRGRTDQSDLEELSVHDEIEKFLAIKLPARELFTREFQFSKELGIYEGGKEKAVDFALFTPEGDRVDSLLEVKRTSSKSTGLQSEVAKDIARLLLLSQRFRCSCYLLICGNMAVIRSELAKIDKYISLVDEDPSRDREFSVLPENFDKEYRSLLDRFQISTGFSRLQGENSSGSNLAVLWQVAANQDNLRMHRPYEFNLSGITRG